MKKRDHIEYWVKSADNDLAAAEALFESAKYDWCLFIAHLVLEKALKANFVLTNESKNLPRIHNLVKLAELSFLNLSDAEILFLDEVNDFNIAARYPDYKQAFYKICTKEYAENYFIRIKEFYEWLKSRLK